jgi:hypothetical protein
MGKSGSFDIGTGELAPRMNEFLAGVLALSRISRVTVALESGHGAGPALLAAARLSAHGETSVLFDDWEADPLAGLAAALFHDQPELATASGENLTHGLRQLQARERLSLLLILDRFDAYLAQPADQAHIAAFDRAFVQMANDSELDVHLLLVLDEAAESMLGRYQSDIPGLGDGCLRMPSGGLGDSADEAPAPEAVRASRRDRSFGMLLERLTAIAPVEEGAPGRPTAVAHEVDARDARPLAPDAAVEPDRPAADLEPAQGRLPNADDPVLDETLPARREPVFAMPDPEPVPVPVMQPAADDTVPAAMADAPRPPADAPARESLPRETPPRRNTALIAVMALVLAIGAGWYAYQQQQPSGATGTSVTAATTPSTAGAAIAIAPAAPAAPAAPPANAPQQSNPAPALMAAPTLAAAAPVSKPAAPTTPATPAVPAPANTASNSTAQAVHVHVRSQRERDRIQSLARTLAGQGVRVVDVKVMNTGPSVADLRYFRDEDKAAAMAVQKAMVSAGVPVPRLSRMNGYENSTRPGYFEAWLGGDQAEEAARRR